MAKIVVENAEIAVISVKEIDYISLTDIAHGQMEDLTSIYNMYTINYR